MHRPSVLPPEALALAKQQVGVLSTWQLRIAGISPKAQERLSIGWARLGRGIHCIWTPTWESVVSGGQLRANYRGVLGDLAAAHTYGLCDPPKRITLWLPGGDHYGAVGWGDWTIRFRRGNRDGDGAQPNGQPKTNVLVTLLDTMPEVDETGAAALISAAFRRGLTTPAELKAAIGASARVPHRVVLKQLCDAHGVESALEWMFESRVRAAHRLPEVDRQRTLVRGTRCDVLFRAYGVIVELDGARYHQQPSRDAKRDNRLALNAGVITLRYTWDDVMRGPCRVAAEIAQILRRRGWQGRLTSCARHCR